MKKPDFLCVFNLIKVMKKWHKAIGLQNFEIIVRRPETN
jgi:hypothetical protein